MANIPVLKGDIPVQVGKYYMVPCAICIGAGLKTIIVPVIGKIHNDAEFGTTGNHYHVDGRFASVNYGHLHLDKFGFTNCVLSTKKEHGYYHIKEIIIAKKLCKRTTTGSKIGGFDYELWYHKMIGKKCPHLGTTMHQHGGALVCPLHGLIGNPSTNKIISREAYLNG